MCASLDNLIFINLMVLLYQVVMDDLEESTKNNIDIHLSFCYNDFNDCIMAIPKNHREKQLP